MYYDDVPRPSPSEGANRVTLVLGGGWKLGCAFHAGVILALRDVWGLDARRVDSLIGTSSGAVVSGLLGAGMSPDDLFRRELGEELSPEGHELMARRRDRGCDADGRSDTTASRTSGTDPRTLGLSVRGALAALLPRGRQSMEPLEDYFDDLVGHCWPSDIDLQFCAVDLGTGQRVALNRASGATVGQAVAASCCIPGLSAPVPIKGREYIDGAVYSINNADLAEPAGRRGASVAQYRTRPQETVIVSAPLSAYQMQLSPGPMSIVRNVMRMQTAAEVRKLCDVDQVILLEPTNSDIAAMGFNMNASARRGRVASSAYTTACEAFTDAPAPAAEAFATAAAL